MDPALENAVLGRLVRLGIKSKNYTTDIIYRVPKLSQN